jgi:hypothetical protein
MAPRKKAKDDPSKTDLIEDFIAVIKSSIIMQIGILVIFIAIAFVIMTGGGIKILGFNLIESEVPEEIFKEYESPDIHDTLYIEGGR